MGMLEDIKSRWIVPPGGRYYWPEGCDQQYSDVRYLLEIIDKLRHDLRAAIANNAAMRNEGAAP